MTIWKTLEREVKKVAEMAPDDLSVNDMWGILSEGLMDVRHVNMLSISHQPGHELAVLCCLDTRFYYMPQVAYHVWSKGWAEVLCFDYKTRQVTYHEPGKCNVPGAYPRAPTRIQLIQELRWKQRGRLST